MHSQMSHAINPELHISRIIQLLITLFYVKKPLFLSHFEHEKVDYKSQQTLYMLNM
jgi:hypothetical protein